RIMEEQNQYYEYQVQMMDSTLSHMRVLRHDFNNKLSPLYELAKSEKIDELIKQLTNMTDMYKVTKEYATSGNSTIDSIINFKLQQVEKQDITISTDLSVPNNLSIMTFDIAIILGNLLDNSLEAVVNIENSRWIDIKVKYTKGRLIIEINNPFDGIVIKDTNKFFSRKQDCENHGLGLRSVQNVVNKYDGVMQVLYDEKVFRVKVLIYLQSDDLGGDNGTISKCTY
ncbi:MAG: ATP-binding protein, partial [Dysgonamonadaceae bacterium]|nr:ATP-binding protein [Dysgonamonadaceae bacterium]